jgi:hypothetical protein
MRRIFPFLVLIVFATAACGDSVQPTITTRGGTTTTTTSPPDGSTSSTGTTLPPSATFTLPPEETTTTSTSSTTTTTTIPDAEEFTITYADGDITGDTEIEVDTGAHIIVIVTSDVEDEVHIHGYDLRADVGPDRAALIEFLTDIPGTFEIELEDEGTLLAELVVGA